MLQPMIFLDIPGVLNIMKAPRLRNAFNVPNIRSIDTQVVPSSLFYFGVSLLELKIMKRVPLSKGLLGNLDNDQG